MKKSPCIAVVGATGMVGSVLLEILDSRNFALDKLFLLASDRSSGDVIRFRGQSLMVAPVAEFDFSQTTLCFFAAGDRVSAEFAEKAAACGNVVIDKSAHFRMHPDVPLVIPEVNPEAINVRPKNIIASPNCSTIPVVMALKPLHDAVGITRINIATYQSVSGSGKEGISELADQTAHLLNGQPVKPNLYAQQIAFNVLPQIDVIMENGYSREEMKLMLEIGKILGDETIAVNATAVRVPVFYGHSAAVHLETREKIGLSEVVKRLKKAAGVKVVGLPDFPTPLKNGAGVDYIAVGRIREDPSHPHGISFWVVGDNVRKGAALNAVQIAEKLFN